MPLKQAKSAYSSYVDSVNRAERKKIDSQNLSNILSAASDVVGFTGSLASMGQQNIDAHSKLEAGREALGVEPEELTFGETFKKGVRQAFKAPDMSVSEEIGGKMYTSQELSFLGGLEQSGMRNLMEKRYGINIGEMLGVDAPTQEFGFEKRLPDQIPFVTGDSMFKKDYSAWDIYENTPKINYEDPF